MTQWEHRVEQAVELVTGFLNSVDVETGGDEFAGPAGARAWLNTHGLLAESARVDAADVRTLGRLRSALRDLAAANHSGEPDAEAAERFSAIARELPLHAAADPAGEVRITPGGRGVEQAAARIVGAVIEASMSNAWSRVKICPADDCLWAFFDRSKNQSRRWCAMGTCGNREKTRAYRERHREHQR